MSRRHKPATSSPPPRPKSLRRHAPSVDEVIAILSEMPQVRANDCERVRDLLRAKQKNYSQWWNQQNTEQLVRLGQIMIAQR